MSLFSALSLNSDRGGFKKGEKNRQTPTHLFKMKKLSIRIFYFLIVRPALRFIVGVRFENKEVFEEEEQFIIVANHNSHFDALSLLAALPAKHLVNTHAVAAADYFGKSRISRIAMNIIFNAIFINRVRAEGEPSAIEILDGYLKSGKSLILFPEGSRGKAGVLADFKKGIAILLKRNPHIHFIPAYLNGFGRVLPKDSSVILPMISKVRFGEAQILEVKDIEASLDKVKEAILSLKPEDERDMNRFRADEEE